MAAPDRRSAWAADLTPTGRVILGMIALGRHTGYDIKQLVDKSTRHFWSASYGQIYPELRRLESQGLVRGRPEPTGARARKVYDLTKGGEAVLEAWLASDVDSIFEVRDEGTLKLFFSDFRGPEERIEQVRAIRDWHERRLEELRSVSEGGGLRGVGPRLAWEMGVGLHQWIADWCKQTERRLGRELEEA